MDDIRDEAAAAAAMINEIEAEQAVKAVRKDEDYVAAVEAVAASFDVASSIADGAVASAQVSDPVTSDPALDPTTEAEAALKVAESVLADKEARAERAAEKLEAFDEDVHEETLAAAEITESVAASQAEFVEKLDEAKEAVEGFVETVKEKIGL